MLPPALPDSAASNLQVFCLPVAARSFPEDGPCHGVCRALASWTGLTSYLSSRVLLAARRSLFSTPPGLRLQGFATPFPSYSTAGPFRASTVRSKPSGGTVVLVRRTHGGVLARSSDFDRSGHCVRPSSLVCSADKSAGARSGRGSLTRNAAAYHVFAARRRFPISHFEQVRTRSGKSVTDAFSRFVYPCSVAVHTRPRWACVNVSSTWRLCRPNAG